eukprot:1321751-Amorphochlora_amoeboformis.AAC.2
MCRVLIGGFVDVLRRWFLLECGMDYFISCVQPVSTTKILDVAGGTGDIAFRAIDYVRRNEK